MIKFGKIYINPLTVALFILCVITRRAELLCVTYAVMTAHEMAHFIAARAIGLRTAYIAFHPFGVNLKLKNKLICRLADEVILYLAGPFLNILAATAAMAVYLRYPLPWLRFFYGSNIMLFIMNMLPIVPLDGGIVVKKILMYRFGYKTAGNIMRAVSAALVAAIAALGAYVVYVTGFNYSVLFLAVFLLANVFTQKEKYNIDFVKELMFYRNKTSKRVRHHIASVDDDCKKVAAAFNAGAYSVVYFLNEYGKIDNIKTETEIIDKILE